MKNVKFLIHTLNEWSIKNNFFNIDYFKKENNETYLIKRYQ